MTNHLQGSTHQSKAIGYAFTYASSVAVWLSPLIEMQWRTRSSAVAVVDVTNSVKGAVFWSSRTALYCALNLYRLAVGGPKVLLLSFHFMVQRRLTSDNMGLLSPPCGRGFALSRGPLPSPDPVWMCAPKVQLI